MIRRMKSKTIRVFTGVVLTSLAVEAGGSVGMLLESDDCARNDEPIILCRERPLEVPNLHVDNGMYDTDSPTAWPWVASSSQISSMTASGFDRVLRFLPAGEGPILK